MFSAPDIAAFHEQATQNILDGMFSNLLYDCTRLEPIKYKDCFFYEEDCDMGARVPYCRYFGRADVLMGMNCPCKGCKKYIKRDAVFNGVVVSVDSSNPEGALPDKEQ